MKLAFLALVAAVFGLQQPSIERTWVAFYRPAHTVLILQLKPQGVAYFSMQRLADSATTPDSGSWATKGDTLCLTVARVGQQHCGIYRLSGDSLFVRTAGGETYFRPVE